MPATVTDTEQAAAALRVSIGLLVPRLRQVPPDGGLTLPETSALARLDRDGPATSSALARLEGISAQSMGATLAELESRGLVERSADPEDGRRIRVAVSAAGLKVLRNRRDARTKLLAHALDEEFTPEEIEHLRAAAPLLERLAHAV